MLERNASSVAVEFDARHNSDLSDPASDHVSIHTRDTNGNDANEIYSLSSSTATGGAFSVGTRTVRISYEPGVFSVYLDNLTTPLLAISLNLETLFPLDQVALGLGSLPRPDGTGFANRTTFSNGHSWPLSKSRN